MAVSKKQQACVNRYIGSHYDRVNLVLAKEGDTSKEAVRAAADRQGLSLNAYIVQAISEKMDRDSKAEAPPED